MVKGVFVMFRLNYEFYFEVILRGIKRVFECFFDIIVRGVGFFVFFLMQVYFYSNFGLFLYENYREVSSSVSDRFDE